MVEIEPRPNNIWHLIKFSECCKLTTARFCYYTSVALAVATVINQLN